MNLPLSDDLEIQTPFHRLHRSEFYPYLHMLRKSNDFGLYRHDPEMMALWFHNESAFDSIIKKLPELVFECGDGSVVFLNKIELYFGRDDRLLKNGVFHVIFTCIAKCHDPVIRDRMLEAYPEIKPLYDRVTKGENPKDVALDARNKIIKAEKERTDAKKKKVKPPIVITGNSGHTKTHSRIHHQPIESMPDQEW